MLSLPPFEKVAPELLMLSINVSGKPEEIQPSVGLYFTDQPATQHPMLLQIQNDRALDIPAGDANFVVSSDFTLPVHAEKRGLLHVGIEIRQDLVGDEAGQLLWADHVAKALTETRRRV